MTGYVARAGAHIGAQREGPDTGRPAATPTVRRAHRLEVRGTVHGVGLRPFVSRLARELGLDGTVRNADRRVVIDASGDPAALATLLRRLASDTPPGAAVTDVAVTDLNGTGPVAGTGFQVVENPVVGVARGEPGTHGVGAELPPCADCVRDLFDPASRFYRYPFVACRVCGQPPGPEASEVPGAAEVQAAGCGACRAEYTDPRSRRHGRAPGCPECGPQLRWRTAADGGPGDVVEGGPALAAAVEVLTAGGVIALKGPFGYQLVCDATAPRAVARLRSGKGCWSKPFAVVVGDLDVARSLAHLSTAEEQLLGSAARPILVALMRRRQVPVAAGVSPGTDRIGLFLPYTPVHHLLLHEVDRPLVVTSGNRSDEPIAIEDDDATTRLGAIADGFLAHGQTIPSRTDDSVNWVVAGRAAVGRRGRGQAPVSLPLPVSARQPVLAVGAQLAHTFTLAAGGTAVVSPHLGNLSDTTKLEVFESGYARLREQAGVTPQVVAHDLHTGYVSTQYATRWHERRRIAVQHHHAHLASCAAEHGVTERFIGIAYDGLGLGDDGTFWGGEVLVADLRGYRRVGRFGVAPLPGGEAAVRRPARTALGYLLGGERLGGAPVPTELVEEFAARFPTREVDTVRRMVAAEVNSPVTSSAACLFDAVASLLRLRDDTAYDGECVAVLEAAAQGLREPELPWRIVTAGDVRVYDPTPTLAALLAGVADGAPVSAMAAGFHATLATVTLALCLDAVHDAGLGTVCLSGDVFTNRLLTNTVTEALRAEDLEVHINERVPTNDGGISYGQAAVAAARMASE
jgi:hydrogenase maturation protein HypF